MKELLEKSSAKSTMTKSQGPHPHTRKKRVQVVKEILENVCDRVAEIVETNSWKKRRSYNTLSYNIAQKIKDLHLSAGKISCVAVTSDEAFTFVGHASGVLAIENKSQEITSNWQNKTQIDVTKICVHKNSSPPILMTVDGLGICRLFFYFNLKFVLIEEINPLNASIIGTSRVTIYDGCFVEGKRLFILKCQKKKIHFIEFRRILEDEWNEDLNTKNDFAASIPLSIIQESQLENYSDLNLIPEHESTLGKKFILDMCNKGYYPKAPSFEWFRLPSSLNLYSSDDYIGVVVWWTGDNSIYLYVISVTLHLEIPAKYFTKWSHTDSVSHCTVSEDSELIAVALQNGTLAIKHLSSGSLKYLIRLCSIGKIDGIWFTPSVLEDDLEIENSTPKSSKSNATEITVTGASVTSIKSRTESRIFADLRSRKTPTAQSQLDITVDINAYRSSSTLQFYKTTKISKSDDIKKEIQTDSDLDKNLDNVSKTLAPTVSVSGTSTLVSERDSRPVTFVDEVNTDDGAGVKPQVSKQDFVSELIQDFHSSFVETFRQPKPQFLFSLVIALSDGSLWQMNWKNNQQLKQLIATTNDNDGVVRVEHVGCKPEMIMVLTRQGKIYLTDTVNEDLINEVTIPISHLILNPWDPIFQTTFFGKKLFIAGCKNVAVHSRRYDHGELFQIDLFPEVDEKTADKIGKALKNKFAEAFEETTRSTTAVKFIPSLKHIEMTKVILQEIFDKFQQRQRDTPNPRHSF